MARRHGALAGVEHEEVARAVGALGLPGREAALPEERRLLVAEQRRERHSADLAHDAARRPDRGQQRARHADRVEQAVVPIERPQIHQQRAARVRRVGRVHAREVPGQPAVDRACGQLPRLGACARAGQRVEQPRQLGAREVGRERQARLRAEAVDLAERGHALRAARVLPHDRVGERAPASRAPTARPSRAGWRCRSPPHRPAARRPRRAPRSMQARERCRISAASCSTHPGRGRIWRCSCWAAARPCARLCRTAGSGCSWCPGRARRRSARSPQQLLHARAGSLARGRARRASSAGRARRRPSAPIRALAPSAPARRPPAPRLRAARAAPHPRARAPAAPARRCRGSAPGDGRSPARATGGRAAAARRPRPGPRRQGAAPGRRSSARRSRSPRSRSSASSAMRRKVVNLPPAIESMPSGSSLEHRLAAGRRRLAVALRQYAYAREAREDAIALHHARARSRPVTRARSARRRRP